MSAESFRETVEKFNFSGKIENSSFKIIETGIEKLGQKEFIVILGNDEIGKQSIRILSPFNPLSDEFTGANIEISHNVRNTTNSTLMLEGYAGCQFLITNIDIPDQAFTLYVKDDLEKLKGMFS